MIFKVNYNLIEHTTTSEMLSVFETGFALLGRNSPMVKMNHFIERRGDVIYCVPSYHTAISNAIGSIANFCIKQSNHFYLQFASGSAEFNQLCAIQKLIELGLIKVS